MGERPQLVLDLAGVLISNFSTATWQALSLDSSEALQTLIEQIGIIRKDLWRGHLSENEFWEWLQERVPSFQAEAAREHLIRSLASLPAWERIEEWNCHADIHILSNHCSEWVGALLEPLKHFTKSITISNQVGLCKPEIEIYEFVSRYFPAGISSNRILYIDDQDKNLRPAKMLGWNTMLADQEQRWIEGVNEWLGTQA